MSRSFFFFSQLVFQKLFYRYSVFGCFGVHIFRNSPRNVHGIFYAENLWTSFWLLYLNFYIPRDWLRPIESYRIRVMINFFFVLSPNMLMSVKPHKIFIFRCSPFHYPQCAKSIRFTPMSLAPHPPHLMDNCIKHLAMTAAEHFRKIQPPERFGRVWIPGSC